MMEGKIKISYVLATYNKYDYLKVTLPYLTSHLSEDEELIIMDGVSKDNTVPFVKEHIKNRKNILFISEADHGESHALNKALLLCRGEIIKNITDDDAFSLYAVRKAADHMLEHSIDIMGFDGYGLSLHTRDYAFSKSGFTKSFLTYISEKKPFFFCGLSYLIKRSSIPLLGFFSTDYKMVDLEYSFRISSGKCTIAWSNLVMFVNIYNANSNTLIFNKQLEKESIGLHKKYCSKKEFFRVLFRFKLQRVLEFKNKLLRKDTFGKNNRLDFNEGFFRSVEILEKENSSLEKIIFYPATAKTF